MNYFITVSNEYLFIIYIFFSLIYYLQQQVYAKPRSAGMTFFPREGIGGDGTGREEALTFTRGPHYPSTGQHHNPRLPQIDFISILWPAKDFYIYCLDFGVRLHGLVAS